MKFKFKNFLKKLGIKAASQVANNQKVDVVDLATESAIEETLERNKRLAEELRRSAD